MRECAVDPQQDFLINQVVMQVSILSESGQAFDGRGRRLIAMRTMWSALDVELRQRAIRRFAHTMIAPPKVR